MSERKRLARIKRLLRLSETRQAAAEAELARARTRVMEAEEHARQSEAELARGAQLMIESGANCAADFVEAYGYMQHLRRGTEHAHHLVEEAEEVAIARTEDATAAYRDVRKMERWGETTLERHRLEQSRKEQRDNDELAARLTAGRDE